MIIKVCGILDSNHFSHLATTGADWFGLNFYDKSKRYFLSNSIEKIKNTTTIGVFVNADIPFIKEKISTFDLDFVQLHGNESTAYCNEIKALTKVIKVFQVNDSFDFKQTQEYNFCDYFLFDTKCKSYGGSGKKFNWEKLQEYTGEVPFILAGGIGPQDINFLSNIKHEKLKGVDINSKFEKSPGIKDVNLVTTFVSQIKKHNHE